MTDEFEQAVRRAAQGLDGAGPSAGQVPTYHDAWERGRRRKFRKQAGMAFAGALVLVAALTLNFGDLGRNSVELDVALPAEATSSPEFLPTTAPVTAPSVIVPSEAVPTVTASTVTVPAESVPTEDGTVAPATVTVVPAPADPVAPAPTATAIPAAPPSPLPTVTAPPVVATAVPVAPTATATPPPTFSQQQAPTPTEVPAAAATDTGPAPSTDPDAPDPTQDSTDPTPGESATSPGVAGLPDIELIGPEQQPDATIIPSFVGGTVLACDRDGNGETDATCTLLPRYSCTSNAEARPGYLAIDLDGDGEFDTCVAPNTTACDSTGDGFADTPCTIELLPEDS